MFKNPLPLHDKYPEYFSKPKPNTYICNCKCHQGYNIMHCAPCCHQCPDCKKMIISGQMVLHKKTCENN